MKRKMLLLILAAMLMAVAAHAAPIIGDNDTLWTKPMSGVTGVKFHPSGETVFVTRESNEFYELDANTGETVYQYRHPNPEIVLSLPRHFDVNKAGTKVASIHYDTVFIWDYETKNIVRRIYASTRMCFFGGPNDKYLFGIKYAEATSTNFWVYDIEKDSVVFDKRFSVILEQEHLLSLATSPDGRYFALVSGVSDFNGDMRSNLAVFDANTFEKVVDVVKNQYGSISEIEFSENAKWIAYKSYFSSTVLMDLQKYMTTGEKEIRKYETSGISFLGNDDHIIGLLPVEPIVSSIINLNNNDTLYKYNYSFTSRKISICRKNNQIVFWGYFPNLSSGLFMLNSNWYKTDVENPIIESIIPSLNYVESNLNYTLNLLNPLSIKISNSTGLILYTNSTNISSSGSISLTLASGIYFFTVNDGLRDYNKKFLVVN